MTSTRLTHSRTVRRTGHCLVAVAAMGAVGCGSDAVDSGSAAASTAAPPTQIQLIEWCPDRDLPDRGRTGPATDAENALADAVYAVSLDYQAEPTWAGSYPVGETGAVFMFTDSDPDRDQIIRSTLSRLVGADDVEIRTVAYTASELDAAHDALREVISDDGWDGLVTLTGYSITRNRVRIGITDLDAAPTFHERLNLPGLNQLFCIEPEAAVTQADTPDGNE